MMCHYESGYKIQMKKPELYHSDTYLGEDFSEGLKHYKYLRKYQKNGKIRYVYAKTKNLDDTKEKPSDIVKEALKKRNQLASFEKNKALYKAYKLQNERSYKQARREVTPKKDIIDVIVDKINKIKNKKIIDFIREKKAKDKKLVERISSIFK